MKKLFHRRKNGNKNLFQPAVELEKTEKKKRSEEKRPVILTPVEEKKSKSNIDLHIVGKIDLDTISKDTKPTKKEEPKEKPKTHAKEKRKEKDIPSKAEAKPAQKKNLKL